METIKNTVSNLVGFGSNNDPATDGTSSATAHTGTTDHTASSGIAAGTTSRDTPSSGAAGDHLASAHHQTTTGGDLGDTVSSATGGSSTGPSGLGHESTTGHGTPGLTSSSHSTGPTSGTDLTDTSRTPAGTSDLTDSSHTSSTSHAATDTAGINRDNKPGDIDVHHKQDSHQHHDPREVQSPAQGPDPALVGEPESHVKLSGSGVPGSHSAVFGLTPDGKRHDDTSHATTTVAPAHSAETTMGRKSVAAGGVLGGEGGVSNQIDAPDTGKKGLERTDPLPSGLTGSAGKPGAGLTGV